MDNRSAKLGLTYDDVRQETVQQVARLMIAAAITAPKSGGQLFMQGAHLFIETVILEDKQTLHTLATWMRARGRERQEAIWFRDAEVAENLDCVLFIGLKDWYPPVYDCGACGSRPPRACVTLASLLSSRALNATCETLTWALLWGQRPRLHRSIT